MKRKPYPTSYDKKYYTTNHKNVEKQNEKSFLCGKVENFSTIGYEFSYPQWGKLRGMGKSNVENSVFSL